MARRRISGIYVPIQLDTSAIQADLQRLSQQLGDAGTTIMRAFQGTLQTNNLVRGFIDITRAMGTLRDSARAMEHLRPLGAFQQAVQQISPELRQLGQTLGLTVRAQQELLTRMAENQAINQQVSALRVLERNLGTTREETLRLARTYGMLVSEMAERRYLGMENQRTEIQRLTDEYNKLVRLAGQTASSQGLQRFIDANRIRQAVDAFRQLNPNMRLTWQNYEEIARAAGVATQQVIEFIRAQEEAGGGEDGAFSFGRIAEIASAIGLWNGISGLVNFAKSAVEATLALDNLKTSFESIYNSSARAATQLDYVRKVSEDLGLSFRETAQGAKTFFASAQGTILEKDVNKIFLAFSNMGAALKLTGDQMQGVFLALSQMTSKGKVMAEELRQQLAERMPGAVTLFAKSIGVTTRELDKMLQDGAVGLDHLAKFADAVQERYGTGAQLASSSLQAELNRLSNAWFDLKTRLVDSEALAEGVKKLGDALRYVTEHIDGVSTLIVEFAKFSAITIAVGALVQGFNAALRAITAFRAALAAPTFAAFLSAIMPCGAAVAALSVAIGGLIYGLTKLKDELPEVDRRLNSMAERTFDLDASIKSLGGSIEDMQDAISKVNLDELESKFQKAKDTFAQLVSKQTKTYSLDAIPEVGMANLYQVTESKSRLDSYFAELASEVARIGKGGLSQSFQATAAELSKKFLEGLENNLSKNELNKIFLELNLAFKSFRTQLDSVANNEKAIQAFDKLKNVLLGAGNNVRTFAAQLYDLGHSTDELDALQEKSRMAYDAIANLAKSSDLSKTQKLEADIKQVISQLVILDENAEIAKRSLESLDYTLDETHDHFLQLRGPIEQLESALPLVASYAVQNGKDFDTMGRYLEDAANAANRTTEEIERLKQALQAAMNIEIGKQIEKELDNLRVKTAQVTAKTADRTAFEIFRKFADDAIDKSQLFAAVQTRDSQKISAALRNTAVSIQQIDSVLAGSLAFGSASDAKKGSTRSGGGSRLSREAKEAQSDLEKLKNAVASTEKEIASIQAQIDSTPSVRFWAQVEEKIGKINALLEKHVGWNVREREELAKLRDEYEKYAQQRHEQLEWEEERQTRIKVAQGFQSWGNLPEVNYDAPAQQMERALKAAYEIDEKNWNDLLQKKLISLEEYNQHMEALVLEANVKIGQSYGSMLASLTDALMKATRDLANWRDQIGDMVVDAIHDMSDALADFALKGMSDVKSLQDAFKNLVDNMIQDLARLFMRMMVMSVVSKVFGGFFGGGGMFGSLGGATAAKGGVFSGGNISDYSGKVVTGPTVFSGTPLRTFAKGGNLMGESGPEVILPLAKGSDGRLGVEATTNPTSVEMNQDIVINIYNQTDSRVTATKSTDDSGNIDIKVMIENMVGSAMTRTGSAPFRALRNVWGGSPQLAQRG